MIPAPIRKELQDKIDELGGQKAVARLIGCSKSHICRIVGGKSDVSMKLARAIRKHLGILVLEQQRA